MFPLQKKISLLFQLFNIFSDLWKKFLFSLIPPESDNTENDRKLCTLLI